MGAGRVLQLMIHSLYGNKEIFLHDAAARTITVSDNGIGMSPR